MIFNWLPKLGNEKAFSQNPLVKQLFDFVHSLINREDLVSGIWNAYLKLYADKTPNPNLFVPLYKELEKFILENKPLVVKQEFTQDSLRREIAARIDIAKLPDALKILFVSKDSNPGLFFSWANDTLIREVVDHFGEKYLTSLIVSPDLTYLRTDGKIYLSGSRAQLKNFMNSLLAQAVSSLGEKTISNLLEREYFLVKSTYGVEMLPEFWGYIPENYLVSERYTNLSQEELSVKVADAVAAERQKRQELDQKNQEMEKTKKAILNLLEDSRQLEKDLSSERDRAKAIITSMGEGLFAVDNNYRVLIMNPAAERILQIKSEDALGKDLVSIVAVLKNNAPLPKDERPLAVTLKTGKPIILGVDDDICVKTAKVDSLPVALVTTPLFDKGQVQGALITFHDISHDKQMKQDIERQVVERTRELQVAHQKISEGWLQLREEKAKLVAAINSIRRGFVMFDLKGEVIIFNHMVSHILDVEHQEWKTDSLQKAFEKVFDIKAGFKQCLKEDKYIEVRSLQFGAKFLNFYMSPIHIEKDKELVGVVFLVNDVTEQVVMERSKDEFFSIASHELRTPLTAIRGNVSLINEMFADKIADPEVKEMLADIHESSVRLIGIVNDFLDISRLELGKMDFKKDELNIGDLITETLREYQVTGSRRKLALDFEKPDKNLPKVIGDKDKIKQVLINMVGNSLKFTEEGGIKLSAIPAKNMIQVTIADTGRGIPLENQSLLFRKFQQAGSSLFTRDTTKGTGLGLYISKLMIEGMGGKIWLVNSEVGKGSTFAFSLPVAKTR